MKFSSCRYVSGMRIFFVGKVTKLTKATVLSDVSYPFSLFLVPTHANETTCVDFANASVAGIFGRRSQTQIGNAIIGFIAVDMVHLFWRPLAVHIKPSQPMGEVALISNGNVMIPVGIAIPRYRSRLHLRNLTIERE